MTTTITFTKSPLGLYDFDTTADNAEELYTVRTELLMLSQYNELRDRGSELATRVANGSLRTDADLLVTFSSSAMGVVDQLNRDNDTPTIDRLELSTIVIENFYKVNITFTVVIPEETADTTITVGTV